MNMKWIIMLSILFWLGIGLFIGKSCAQQADTAECVWIPYSQEIVRECDKVTPRYYYGCSQRLSRDDPGENWTSPDHPRGGGPAFSLVGGCDVPTDRAERGAVRVRFQSGRPEWVVIKQVVYPPQAALLLEAPDQQAIPPDTLASSYLLDSWHCDDTNEAGPRPHIGPYARALQWGQRASETELYNFSIWPFTDDPDFWTAYGGTVIGYSLLDPQGHHNPHAEGTPESVINAWKKRWAIMHEMHRLKEGDPIMQRMCWVGVQTAEYYLQKYGYFDEGRLAAIGLWLYETAGLDAALEQWFLLTGCGVPCDPNLIFQDIDVSLETTSWGMVKAQFK